MRRLAAMLLAGVSLCGLGLGLVADGAAAQSTSSIPVCIVVDFGLGSPIHPPVVRSCFSVAPGSTGADVLQQFTERLRIPAPGYAPSGLLCAIGGYPSGGCGGPSGGHFPYWSYWRGGATWTYATLGPAEVLAAKGDVEGWRYQPTGSATPRDPPPRAASSAASLVNFSVTRPAGFTPTATAGPFWLVIVAVGLLGGVLVLSFRRLRRP